LAKKDDKKCAVAAYFLAMQYKYLYNRNMMPILGH
jgi:hypothetical protein